MKKSLTPPRQWPALLAVAGLLVFGGWRLSSSLNSTDQSLYALGMGSNQSLQLGGQKADRAVNQLSTLELPTELVNAQLTSLKAGHYHTLLLTKDGQVYAFGSNALKAVSPSNSQTIGNATRVTFPELAPGEVITQIDTSRDHNIALTNHGRVYTWGSNYTAQLGDGTNTDRGEPRLVHNVPKASFATAGYRHSAVITENGEVWGWGGSCTDQSFSEAEALAGKLGENISALGAYGSTTQADLTAKDPGECTTQVSTFVQSKTPKKLTGFAGKPVELSAGYGHLLVRTEDGKLYSAGCNSFQQLGRTKANKSANNLAEVPLPQPITHVSAGFRHTVVLLKDGTVMTWGYNGPATALHVDSREFTVLTPTKVDTPDKMLDIEAAHDTTFALTTQHNLMGWGQDDAEAFWGMQTSRDIHTMGTVKNSKDVASAGMQHLLVLETADD